MAYNVTTKIQEHYDLASPYYRELWGPHLHHGYYETGKESQKQASDRLLEVLVQRSKLPKQARVLDVGCGIGTSAIWLSHNWDCKVTGITISPVQLEMAKEAAREILPKPRFLLHDANELQLSESFDAIWAVEVISHLSKRAEFFKRVSGLLGKNGIICIAAWLKDSDLNDAQEKKYIQPIEEGMLVDLPTLSEYKEHFDINNLRLRYYEDVSMLVSHTWDVCLKIAKDRTLWRLAYEHSGEFVSFLKSFGAMKNGYKSGAFRYAFIVAEKR